MFESYAESEDRSIMLFQPEVLLILERLEADRYKLQESWAEIYPLGELERLATNWGSPL
jgi:hypothetical protein